jgi:hypothetical protein
MNPLLRELTRHADAGYVLLWTLADKRSHWHPAADPPAELPADADIYIGISLAPEGYGPAKRCPADQTYALMAFAADVDITHPLHSKADRLPPDEDAALAIIAACGLQPTCIIHSGHGLQAWWLLKEPWTFDDDTERERAAGLSQAWSATLKAHAQQAGYTMDSTFDLARIMRLPETHNAKDPADIKPVVILDSDWQRRYNPADFHDWLLADPSPQAQQQLREVTVNPDAHFPVSKHEALLENDSAYKRSWEHKRTDLEDTSLSGYDMSLVCIAAAAGWSDDELAALIREHRDKHGGPPDVAKGKRPDYIRRTLQRAQREQEADHAVETLLHGETLDGRVAEMERLRAALDLQPLTDVHRITGAEQVFVFHINGSALEMPVKELVSQQAFRKAIFGLAGIMPKKLSQKAWDKTAKVIYQCALELDAGSEAGFTGQIRAWVQEFVDDRGMEELDEGEQPQWPEIPFRRDGYIYLRIRDLSTWLTRVRNERLTQPRIRQRLKNLSAERKTVPYRTPKGKATTGSFWRIPETILDE